MKPITPAEVRKTARLIQIPDGVIQVFNRLIAENFHGGRAEVLQGEAVIQIKALDMRLAREWDDRWLNIETVFENAGWKVEYDKPGYNESYPAKFTFTEKK